MYRLAYQTLKKNIALYAFFIVLIVTVERFVDINSGLRFVLGAFIALFTHRMILLDENYGIGGLIKPNRPTYEKPPILGFFLVSGLWLVVLLLLMAAVFYVLFIQIYPVDMENQDRLIGALIISLAPAIFVYGLLLSLFGTMLPAAAIGANKSLSAALQRGKASFWITFGRLAFGGFSVSVVGTALVFGIMFYLDNAGLDVDSAAVDIPLSILAYSINFGSILLAVTALSMAYQSAENQTNKGLYADEI